MWLDGVVDVAAPSAAFAEAAGYDLLKALSVVLGVATLMGVLSRWLRQPVVLGYLVAGLLVGPHLRNPLVADPRVVHTLSELGVILLMFSLGLGFSIRKLFRVGASVAVTAVIECSILFWIGFTAGRLFGWTLRESLFAGAIIAISSTTIIAKAFGELNVTGRLRELVIGILIVEDLIAIVLMATLTSLSTGAGVSAHTLAITGARLGAFLTVLIVVGLLVVPRAMRRIIQMGRPEATVVASVGLCFGTALFARELGYSVALGAFLAGSLIAESGEEQAVANLVQPLRDLFAAVFFVSVGMMIDPAVVVRHWGAVVAFTGIVVVGKVGCVGLAAFLTGNGTRTSTQAGMSLSQIGEFSFIIAGLGVSLGATRDFLYPVAVTVSAITTLTTPWLIRASTPCAAWVDRHLPRPLQIFVSLYGSWLERLRAAAHGSTKRRSIRRLVRLLALDGAGLAAVMIGNALGAAGAERLLVERAGLGLVVARAVVLALAAALGAPFCIGVVRVARKLGTTLADLALPSAEAGSVDLATAPRRLLVVTLQLVVILLVGAPLVAITQPFSKTYRGAELLLVILVVMGAVSWRRARSLQGHVRAGAQVIIEALARQTASSMTGGAVSVPLPLHAIIEALGEPVAITLTPSSPAVGKTLGELNLRGLTGATVLAITREEIPIVVPSSAERLRAGDTLAIGGTREAVASARVLLLG